MVYTDADGNRLAHGDDGKFYAPDQLEKNGKPKAGAQPIETVKLSLVGPDGSTKSNTVLGNVAEGVAVTDAVNKGQLDKAIKDVKSDLSKDGVDTKDKKGNETSVKADGVTVTGKDGDKTHVKAGEITLIHGKNGVDGTTVIGKDGKPGITGRDGKDGKSFDLNLEGLTVTHGKDGADGKAHYGADGLVISGPAGADGKPGKTVVIRYDKVDLGGNRITHVAPGVADDDAATVGQLKQASGAVTKALDDVKKESASGDARLAALAAFKPVGYLRDDESQIMAGVGYNKGAFSLALGYGYYYDEDRFLNAGLAFDRDSGVTANLGMAWRLGDDDKKDDRTDAEKRTGREARLTRRVEQLERQVADLLQRLDGKDGK